MVQCHPCAAERKTPPALGTKRNRAIQLAPSESSRLANLVLPRLRQGDLEAVANFIAKARALAPGSSALDSLAGTVAA